MFKTRADFKQFMSLYALQHQFRFKNARSSPEGMVLTCISTSCKWRVYATKLKNVENYEIRKVILEHTCSIDDRAGNLNYFVKPAKKTVKNARAHKVISVTYAFNGDNFNLICSF